MKKSQFAAKIGKSLKKRYLYSVHDFRCVILRHLLRQKLLMYDCWKFWPVWVVALMTLHALLKLLCNRNHFASNILCWRCHKHPSEHQDNLKPCSEAKWLSWWINHISNSQEKSKSDGRKNKTRRPASTCILFDQLQIFWFDQLLQTVKNVLHTVLNLVFKAFLQTAIPPLFIYFMQKRGYHDFPLNIFRRTVPKKFVGEPFGISKNFEYR